MQDSPSITSAELNPLFLIRQHGVMRDAVVQGPAEFGGVMIEHGLCGEMTNPGRQPDRSSWFV